MLTSGPVSETGFNAIRQGFADLGDRLSDAQLLELADACHEMLRWRRRIRCRHPAVATYRPSVQDGGKRTFVEAEPRFIPSITD